MNFGLRDAEDVQGAAADFHDEEDVDPSEDRDATPWRADSTVGWLAGRRSPPPGRRPSRRPARTRCRGPLLADALDEYCAETFTVGHWRADDLSGGRDRDACRLGDVTDGDAGIWLGGLRAAPTENDIDND